MTAGSGAGAGGAVGTVVMDSPKSVTANFNVAYTVTTVPEGLSVMVDSVTYTTPQDVRLGSGVGSLGLYVYHRRRRRRVRRGRGMSIRVGVTVSRAIHWLTLPQTSTTYTATFGKQYSLTTASNPAAGWFGDSGGSELVECGCDGDGSDGDGESGVPVYGMERCVDIDGEFCDGSGDGWSEDLDGELWKVLAYTVTSVPSGAR